LASRYWAWELLQAPNRPSYDTPPLLARAKQLILILMPSNDTSSISRFLLETVQIAQSLNPGVLVRMLEALRQVRDRRGRLFILGLGGSAASASHAVNDFRKIAGIEAYAPTDNVAEFTARINDDGWDSAFVNWLRISRLNPADALLILSVGGGTSSTSTNLVEAMSYAKSVGATILSIVSREGGRALGLSDVAILVPVVAEERTTAHAESWQGVLWHLFVSVLHEDRASQAPTEA
jgi:D-sedoheptulose 7-phosphate isomerase